MLRKRTTRVIFHHSLSARDVDIKEITSWHKARGIEPVGYHYYIRKNGLIEAGRDHTEVGAHAKGKNSDSIGVCLSGDFRTEPPTAAQVLAAHDLYVCLCLKYGPLVVDFHRDLTDNPCPGPMLQRAGFEDGLLAAWEEAKEMANLDAFRVKLTGLLEKPEVGKLKDDVLKDVLAAAEDALKPYDPKKNAAAGNRAAIDSLIAVTAAAVTVTAAKSAFDVDSQMESVITGIVGLVVASLISYVRSRVLNYKKHNK